MTQSWHVKHTFERLDIRAQRFLLAKSGEIRQGVGKYKSWIDSMLHHADYSTDHIVIRKLRHGPEDLFSDNSIFTMLNIIADQT